MAGHHATRHAFLVVGGLILITAGLIAVLFFAQSTMTIATRDRAAAMVEMDQVRARFGHAAPCVSADTAASDSGHGANGRPDSSPDRVHMLAWQQDDERLVRASIPYWALRAGAFKVNMARAFVEPLRYVTFADLERCGRGLILDRVGPGGRVIIWTE